MVRLPDLILLTVIPAIPKFSQVNTSDTSPTHLSSLGYVKTDTALLRLFVHAYEYTLYDIMSPYDHVQCIPLMYLTASVPQDASGRLSSAAGVCACSNSMLRNHEVANILVLGFIPNVTAPAMDEYT